MTDVAEKLAVYEKSLDKLDDLIKIQASPGNWNYDEYMLGLANGLLLAKSVFDGKPAEFLEEPERWLKDEDIDNEPVIVQTDKVPHGQTPTLRT